MTSTYQKKCEILRIYELIEGGKITIPVPGRLRDQPCKMTVLKGVIDMAGSSLLQVKSNILGNSYDTGTQGTNVVLGTAINNVTDQIPKLRASVIRGNVNVDNASSNVITDVHPTVSISNILPGDIVEPDGVYIDVGTTIASISFESSQYKYTLNKATLPGNISSNYVMYVTPSEVLGYNEIFSPLNESVPIDFHNVTLPPEIDIQIVNKTGVIATGDRYVELVLQLEF